MCATSATAAGRCRRKALANFSSDGPRHAVGGSARSLSELTHSTRESDPRRRKARAAAKPALCRSPESTARELQLTGGEARFRVAHDVALPFKVVEVRNSSGDGVVLRIYSDVAERNESGK